MKPYTLAEIQRDGKYIRVVFYYQHPITGKNKKFPLKGGINRLKTEKDKMDAARDLRDETNARLKSGQINAQNLFPELSTQEQRQSYTIRTAFEAIDGLLAIQFSKEKKGKDNNTYSELKSIKNKFLKWATLKGIISQDINFISQQHLHSFLDWVEKEFKIGDVTYNNYLKKLSRFFTSMLERGMITQSPLKWDGHTRQFKTIPRRKTGYGKSNIPYTEEQKKALYEGLVDKFFELLVYEMIIYSTGRRIKEIVKLQIYSIDLSYEYFIVGGDISKNKNTKAIPISNQLKWFLKKLELHKYPKHYYIFSKPLLKPSEEKISHYSVFRHWRNYVTAPIDQGGLGLPIGMYRGKHTGAKDMLDSGIFDLEDLNNLYDHKDFATTRRYAASFSPNRLKKVINNSPDFLPKELSGE